jgi:hypothetical protein
MATPSKPAQKTARAVEGPRAGAAGNQARVHGEPRPRSLWRRACAQQGRPVVALTEATAAIQNPTGAITIYRRHNKPALAPIGDSLDDF